MDAHRIKEFLISHLSFTGLYGNCLYEGWKRTKRAVDRIKAQQSGWGQQKIEGFKI